MRKTVPTTMTQDRRRHTWLQKSLTLTLFRYGTKTEQCTGRVRNRLRLRLPHRNLAKPRWPQPMRSGKWKPQSEFLTHSAQLIGGGWPLDAVRPQQGVDFCQRRPHDAVRPPQAVVRLLVTPAPTPPPRAEGRFEGRASAVHAVCVLFFWRHRRFDVKTKTPWAIEALCIIIIRIVGYGGLDASACFLGFPAAGVPDKRFHHQQLSEERRVRPGPVRGWSEPTPNQT